MTELSSEELAKRVMNLQKQIAKDSAKRFEEWCFEHKSSTKEVATEKLENIIFNAIKMSVMALMFAGK